MIIEYIAKPQVEPIKFVVKNFLNIIEFSDKPITSFIVGIYVVNTNELSNLYSIHKNNLKNKCFFIKVSSCKAILSTLNHKVL